MASRRRKVGALECTSVTTIFDGEPSKFCTHNLAERIQLKGVDSPDSKPTARTSMGEPLPMCCFLMEPTTITNCSRKTGTGGTGSTQQGTWNLRGWRWRREMPRKICESIVLQSPPGVFRNQAGRKRIPRTRRIPRTLYLRV